MGWIKDCLCITTFEQEIQLLRHDISLFEQEILRGLNSDYNWHSGFGARTRCKINKKNYQMFAIRKVMN